MKDIILANLFEGFVEDKNRSVQTFHMYMEVTDSLA